MLLEARRKLILYDMNLKYPIENWTDEGQTNWLINKKMNEFEYLYNDTSQRIFILDYKDDLLSVICYKMLSNIQSICKFKFQIYILGKTFHTKQYLGKYKTISKLKTNILINKKQCVVVQPVNPLYNVVNSKRVFKKFLCPTWNPINDFTPRQLQTAQIFYHIGYLKKDKIQFDKKEVISFISFLDGSNNEWCESNNGNYPIICYSFKFAVVKLTNDIEKDQELLRNIEDYDGLVYYFYDGEEKPQLLTDANFLLSLKNWVNLPKDGDNINNYEIPKSLVSDDGFLITYYGSWTQEEKEKLGEIKYEDIHN